MSKIIQNLPKSYVSQVCLRLRDTADGVIRERKRLFRESSIDAAPESCDDAVLIDVRVYVRSIDEDADCSSDCHSEEDVQR